MTNVLNFPAPAETEVISEEAFRKYTDAALLLKCFEVVKDTLDVINEPEYSIEKEDDTHIDLIRAFYALKVLFDRKTGIRLRRTLRNIHKTMDNELQPAMAKSAARVLATQQQLIPKDTGAASAALRVYVAPSGLDAQVGIRGKRDNRRFFYLRFLEYGTKGYSGSMYQRADRNAVGGVHTNNRDKSKLKGRRNVLRQRDTKNKSDGQHFFGKYPDIPARPAHPWLRPSLDVNREYVMADLEEAVRRTLRKASQGVGNG